MHNLSYETSGLIVEYIYLTLEASILEKKITDMPNLHHPLISIRKELRDIKKQMQNQGIKVHFKQRKGSFVKYDYYVKNQGQGSMSFLIPGLKMCVKDRLNHKGVQTL